MNKIGLRFRKSFKITPGIKFNLNKRSVGLTFGGKGLNYTVNAKGKRTKSVGIPGTGLYYTTSSSTANKKSSYTTNKNYLDNKDKESKTMTKKWYQKTWFIITMLICFFPVGLYLMWKYSNWKKIIKVIITATFILFCFLLGGDSETTSLQPENTTDTTVSLNIYENETTTKIDTTKEFITQTQSTEYEKSTTDKQNTTEKQTTTQKQTTTKKTNYYSKANYYPKATNCNGMDTSIRKKISQPFQL